MTESTVPAVRETTTDPSQSFIATLDERWRLAKALVASGMIPQKRPEAAIAVMLKAYELGVPPMQAFGCMHFFDGKLILDSTLMDGLAASRCGVRKRILESTETVCKIEFTRPGWEPMVVQFTIKEAQAAGLVNKDNWKKYPKDMLAARCKARGLRLIAPDYFAGTYAVEEMDPHQVSHEPTTGAGLDDLTARLEHKAETTEPAKPEPATAETLFGSED